jgi:NAD(P)-dependent dehydrogenase (short-subunit alcohol dehydrogenase family)
MTSSRTVLVTGASSGIGRAVALALRTRGYRVVGASRRATPGRDEDGIVMLPLDVRSDASVHQCVEEVRAQAGALDVLVNNAGFALLGAAEETTIAEAQGQLDTNFFGVVRMIGAVLPLMRERRAGRIVNVSSVAGLVGMPFGAFYSASKFALEGYTESLRHEVKPFGIHVSLVEPGFVRTRIAEAGQVVAASLPAYAGARSRIEATIARSVEAGIDPARVAACVVRVVESRSPRLRYRVGADASWVPRIKQTLPWPMFEAVTRRLFRLDETRGDETRGDETRGDETRGDETRLRRS